VNTFEDSVQVTPYPCQLEKAGPKPATHRGERLKERKGRMAISIFYVLAESG